VLGSEVRSVAWGVTVTAVITSSMRVTDTPMLEGRLPYWPVAL
jgi:hypothetical protein